MFIKAQVRSSTIFGKGLFALEPVPRGRIVCFFSLNGSILTEEQYVQAVERREHHVMRTGTRYAGKYFAWCDQEMDLNFINHSFEPNLLCHCGIAVARRAIAAQEELTVDYRTLLDTTDVGLYNDAATGREIRGFSAKETFLRTASELIRIVEETDGWEG